MPSLKCPIWPASVAVIALFSGCGKQTATYSNSEDISRREPAAVSRVEMPSGPVEQRRAELLNRIRAADPQQRTIQRALINEHNELGLIMNKQANLDDIPKLMKVMLSEMAESFPHQDLTAIAYAPTQPPMKIGTGRLNARTRDMTYTPESPR